MIGLDLNLLLVFDAVMSERHVTRAARRLGMTQPAVSNALGRLREALGDELVLKVPGGVAPTSRALAMWPSLRAALGQIRDTLRPPAFDPARMAAAFALAMNDDLASLFVPPLARRLERRAPEVDLRVVPNVKARAPAALERGEAAMVLCTFPRQGAHLHARPVLHDRYMAVMRQGHPLAKRPLTPERFASARHLLVSPRGDPRGFVDALLEARGFSRRVGLSIHHFSLAPRLVAETDLVATLTLRTVVQSGLGHRLHVVPLPFELPPVEVRLVWHEREQNNPAHAWLRSELCALGAELEGDLGVGPAAAG
jgi:DNA-binding transcriptional LysR family regulator